MHIGLDYFVYNNNLCMMKKYTVVAYDFDGTITSKDTLLEFIRYSKGVWAFLYGFMLYSPLLILMKLKLYPNWKTKQKIFSYYYKGMKLDDFNLICNQFANDCSYLLRNSAIKSLQNNVNENNNVVIISASVDNWVIPFMKQFKVIVIGTRIETDNNNIITGRFLTKNCYGLEKINRLLNVYPNRKEYNLYAYGDSRGDKELLKFADESFYRIFY